MLILWALESDDSITVDSLYETSFWIWMYNLPANKWIVKVVNLIGAKMGTVQQVEDESLWNRCIQFKVKILVDKLLQLGLFVKDSESRRSWVCFCYEKLPEFCYWCGYIRHSEKDYSRRDKKEQVVKWS